VNGRPRNREPALEVMEATAFPEGIVSDGVPRQQAFLLNGFASSPGHGSATVITYDRPARWRRALQALGKWWGIALLSVFIPVAHFVLVPAFFLFGLFQFSQRLGAVEVPREARGTCPDCGAEQPLELAARWQVPQLVTCRQCHRGLRLTSPVVDQPA
jgi:hypothetical protein